MRNTLTRRSFLGATLVARRGILEGRGGIESYGLETGNHHGRN